ncbi:MAG: hypothetical protein M0Q44_07080 [Methylobacter sp.]|nr:hypothetical protein [Methylobacter sp.]
MGLNGALLHNHSKLKPHAPYGSESISPAEFEQFVAKQETGRAIKLSAMTNVGAGRARDIRTAM